MDHRIARWTVLASVAVLATAAWVWTGQATPPSQPEASPLFEVEFVNFAWGRVWRGTWIDHDGHVYSFDLGRARESGYGDSVMTAARLTRKYDHERTLVKTLPPGEAAGRYALVARAARGPFSAEREACADAGTARFSAWIYHAADGTYHRLLLHQRGDVAQANLSPAARELYHWLAGVTGSPTRGASCEPFAG
jgi:hypothetical protein